MKELLTESQKNIIDLMICEFGKLNSKTSTSNDGLFNVDKIKSDFIDKEKRLLELKEINKSFLKLRQEMILSDYSKLKPEMDKLNIPIEIGSNKDGYIKIDIGTGCFGYSNNNISLGYELTMIHNHEFGTYEYTGVIRGCYLYSGDIKIKFSSLEEFCEEISKEALLKVYSYFAKQ